VATAAVWALTLVLFLDGTTAGGGTVGARVPLSVPELMPRRLQLQGKVPRRAQGQFGLRANRSTSQDARV
jgi:hypothetical protein